MHGSKEQVSRGLQTGGRRRKKSGLKRRRKRKSEKLKRRKRKIDKRKDN